MLPFLPPKNACCEVPVATHSPFSNCFFEVLPSCWKKLQGPKTKRSWPVMAKSLRLQLHLFFFTNILGPDTNLSHKITRAHKTIRQHQHIVNNDDRLPYQSTYYQRLHQIMAVATSSPKARVCTKAKMTKTKVSFSNVSVRMYPITIGNNPGGADGPPLSLSWDYTSLGKATVEDFELHRKDPKFQRRNQKSLHIPAHRRVGLLKDAGFSEEEIYMASREAAVERQIRRSSVHQAIMQCKAIKAARDAAAAAPAQSA